MFSRLGYMIVKEFIHLLRDPRMRTVVIFAPIFQLIVFGYAANMDVKLVKTAVCDLDRTPVSRELLSHFDASPYFEITHNVNRQADLIPLIDKAEADAGVVIPPGFGAGVKDTVSASIQVIIDGSTSTIAQSVAGYIQFIIYDYNLEIVTKRLDLMESSYYLRSGTTIPAMSLIDLRERAWFNSNLVSRNFYIPGVIALLILLVTLMLTAMAVVREREMGTMEQLLVAPIRPWELILGKAVPFAIVALMDVTLVIIVAIYWFNVPFMGGVFFFVVCCLFYIMSTLSAGLYISTLCRSQQQAMLTTFLFLFPALLLSGFIFPINNMPEVIQWLTYLNPLRYFIEIVRGVFLKGVGFMELWQQLVALAVLGLIFFTVSTARFRRKLE